MDGLCKQWGKLMENSAKNKCQAAQKKASVINNIQSYTRGYYGINVALFVTRVMYLFLLYNL